VVRRLLILKRGLLKRECLFLEHWSLPTSCLLMWPILLHIELVLEGLLDWLHKLKKKLGLQKKSYSYRTSRSAVHRE